MNSPKKLSVKSRFSLHSSLSKRKFFQKQSLVSLPNLIEPQIVSYQWFLKEGLKEIFNEVSPIADFTGKEMEVSFSDYYLDEPKYDEITARKKNVSYEAPLRVKTSLLLKKTGEVREQEIFLTDFPLMTDRGTFIVNGVERVVVSQLIRSPGAFFSAEYQKGKKVFGAKIIPNRGAWLELETDLDGVIWVKIDRKRKIAATSLLRIFGLESDEEIKEYFKDVDNGETSFIEATLTKDPVRNVGEAYREVYRRLRPGDLATEENAKQMIDSMFFDFDRYDFGRVGCYRLNLRLDLNRNEKDEKSRILDGQVFFEVVKEIIRLNNNPLAKPDDIDHLGSRRLRGVGEMVQNKIRIGFARMNRNIKDRMSTCDPLTVMPGQLINPRPVAATIKEFFSSSQLSQFMDQVNPLAELEHKRRLSAMGPGGLTRERAGFEVRDVHPSHYGRICPVQTPEGPNIGLVGHLACYARVNEYGFLETPYRLVKREISPKAEKSEWLGRILEENVKDSKGQILVKKGEKISEENFAQIAKADKKTLKVIPFITGEIEYFNAIKEEKFKIAHAGIEMDQDNNILEETVACRFGGDPLSFSREEVDYVDASSKQCISVAKIGRASCRERV